MAKNIESLVSSRFKFSKDRFGNWDNVIIQTQFRRIRQYTSIIKRRLFVKDKLIHFHINSTRVFWKSKWNKLSFLSKEIIKSLPTPIHLQRTFTCSKYRNTRMRCEICSKLTIKTPERQKQPPKLFYKKSVLRNFAKFTGKHLCQGLFFNKVAGLRPQ